MPETSELHQKVDKILRRVESMDNFMPWLVRHQAADIKKELIDFFNKRKRAAKVYLAVDGKRAISDISQFTGIAQPNVSAEIKSLIENGLIEAIVSGKNTICRKNKIDTVLGLSKYLESIFKQNNIEVKEENNVSAGDSNTIENPQPNQSE